MSTKTSLGPIRPIRLLAWLALSFLLPAQAMTGGSVEAKFRGT
mgnify:FL=1